MNRLPFRLIVALSVLLPILASCTPLFGSRESGSGGGNPGGGGPGGDPGGGVTYTLTVTVEGEGSVSVSPVKAVYNSGELITITAVPDPDHFLSHWGGDAEGWILSPLLLGIGADTSITAVFSPDLWSRATETAGWSARDGHAVVSFDDRLWVLGGLDGGGNPLNDVWSWSSEGSEAWAQVTAGAPWEARTGHGAVVHAVNEGDDEEIWIIGGAYRNDVWRSTNGEDWTEVTVTDPWSARTEFLTLAHGDSLWVLGGLDGGTVLNDVWSSTDGVTWAPVSPTGEIWSPRRGHAGVVFDGKLWVIGGVGEGGALLSDVWYSDDGETWEQATADAGWPVRSGHAAAVHNSWIWVFGGTPDLGIRRYRDVWSSSDGVDWTAEPHGSWSPRSRHRALSHDNRLWMIGGAARWPGQFSSKMRDVWYLPVPQ